MNNFKMEVQWISPDLLKPYEDNAKKHPPEQIEDIAYQIRETGFDQPIVLEPDYTIMKGHGRWLASKQIGLQLVPVVFKQVTKDQARAQRLADNKLAMSEFDGDSLRKELAYLKSINYDSELTGYSEEETEAILSDLDREVDYSAMDGESVDGKVEQMTRGVRKSMILDFTPGEYEEAYLLAKFFRDRGEYLGGMFIRLLQEEKNKVIAQGPEVAA